MSGHNRWSKLKRFKAIAGVVKGKLWSRLIKELTVAARLGGGDPGGNPRLRTALFAAREANMPKDTIERAVKKGTGELEGAAYEEVLYEGYGPGGVALLVECLTDNTNRSANDVRSCLLQYGGNLGLPGSVRFVFQKRGLITVKAGPGEDVVMERALDAGADDVIDHGAEGFEVRTEPQALHAVAEALEQSGLGLAEQKLAWLPTTSVTVTGEAAAKLVKLLEVLDDNDDVQNVFSNFEIEQGELERLSG
jgi:YebC/PmpR family DNA-binding regulatory protein